MHIPRHAHEMGDGHILLRPREETAKEFSDKEHDAIRAVCDVDKRQKWGRLQLPNGQVARSLYSENQRLSENKRNTRNVKVRKPSDHGNHSKYFLVQAEWKDRVW